MMTIKNTLKAASVAVLFTAGLAAAQGPIKSETAAAPITFTVNVEPTASITVTNQALTKSSANLFREGVTVTGTNTTAPMLAGRVAIVTNMYSWDVLVKSKHEGKLMNSDATQKQLACGITPAALKLFACMTATATTTVCPTTGTVGTTSSPRRTLTLTGSDVSPISTAQFVKAAADGTPEPTQKFTGAEVVATNSSVWMLIEANVDCLATSLAPAVGATDNIYTEELQFTLVSGW